MVLSTTGIAHNREATFTRWMLSRVHLFLYDLLQLKSSQGTMTTHPNLTAFNFSYKQTQCDYITLVPFLFVCFLNLIWYGKDFAQLQRNKKYTITFLMPVKKVFFFSIYKY